MKSWLKRLFRRSTMEPPRDNPMGYLAMLDYRAALEQYIERVEIAQPDYPSLAEAWRVWREVTRRLEEQRIH